jgi:hypothetical protein
MAQTGQSKEKGMGLTPRGRGAMFTRRHRRSDNRRGGRLPSAGREGIVSAPGGGSKPSPDVALASRNVYGQDWGRPTASCPPSRDGHNERMQQTRCWSYWRKTRTAGGWIAASQPRLALWSQLPSLAACFSSLRSLAAPPGYWCGPLNMIICKILYGRQSGRESH